MNRIDFQNIGGNPIDQQSFEFMQDAYTGPLGALAKLCGNKTIITGVVAGGGSVTAGWIVYNGELIQFQAGASDTGVLIEETASYTADFDDTSTHDEEFVKTARCVASGETFLFSDLKRLDTLLVIQELMAAWIGKQYAYISYTGTSVTFDPGFGTGAVTANDSVITITIPNQGSSNYRVVGSLVGLQSDPNLDNDVMWVITNKTSTSFQLAVSGAAVVQSIRFEYAIIKNS